MARVKGVDWDLEGEQLSIKWALALCYACGFRGPRLVSAVAVMWAESGRWTRAWNKNYDDDGTLLSIDRGLWQMNSTWQPLSEAEAFDPLRSTQHAALISDRGRYFKPWAAFSSGRYLLFHPLVLTVWALGTWRTRVARVEQRFGG